MMKKINFSLGVALLSVTGAVFSQDASSEIVVSTDPARAAAVEQHAQEIRAQQQGTSEMAPAQHPMMKHHMSGHAMMMGHHTSKQQGHRHGKKHGTKQN